MVNYAHRSYYFTLSDMVNFNANLQAETASEVSEIIAEYLSRLTDGRANDDLLGNARRSAANMIENADADLIRFVSTKYFNSHLFENIDVINIKTTDAVTGAILPIAEKCALIRSETDKFIHVDATLTMANLREKTLADNADIVSINMEYLHGPNGITAIMLNNKSTSFNTLIGRADLNEKEILDNKPELLVGTIAAFELNSKPELQDKVETLNRRLNAGILNKIAGSNELMPADIARLPNTNCLYFENVNGEMLKELLAANGISAATGSVCGASETKNIDIFEELNIPFKNRASSISFSISKLNTEEEIDDVIAILPKLVSRLRSFSK